jgi:hypothetical protein
MNASEKQQWEVEYYGCPIAKIDEIVRESYVPPRDAALSFVNFATCLIDSGRGESNRDEILHALHRAQWILNNKVSAERPC